MHQSRAIRRIKRNSSAQKNIMNVRLSFGPIYVPQPFESRLISCNLDLINHKTLNADYDYKVFAFLSNQDLGVDMTAKDYAEYTKTKSVERQQTNPGRIVPVVTTSDAVVTTPAPVVTTESSVVTTQSSVVTTQSSVITSAPAETRGRPRDRCSPRPCGWRAACRRSSRGPACASAAPVRTSRRS